MESLALTQYHFHNSKDINEEHLQLIEELNDEIVCIYYLQNIVTYSFPSNEYINLKDLLYFKVITEIFNIGKEHLGNKQQSNNTNINQNFGSTYKVAKIKDIAQLNKLPKYMDLGLQTFIIQIQQLDRIQSLFFHVQQIVYRQRDL
ncbi:unnamed protein product (macronuclear) [Paramecium tetraurelia]|uniref:Uncharacterized protein n=1 Tax=Paramecium tetraurelia TaxID=5888 RepID=A0BYK4_PARTE|nr:uncharacterized protein GSPATT00033474001 [Paramecium tetraurelia]CAK63621.1 unnamed protein product [Paramecium tetraurelia]|eukprot:XP_001431019.1 hypothetical protein (macronuclear) [Paramecium tetraurelia strain d4-2]